jgi:hypothetical protein
MAIIFDIETYGDDLPAGYLAYKTASIKAPSNYKKEDAIQQYIEKAKEKLQTGMALEPMTGKIILIGLLSDRSMPEPEWVKVQIEADEVWVRTIGLNGLSENEIINEVFRIWTDVCDNSSDFRIVGYNSKKFDLPFILGRTLIKGITVPERLPLRELLNRWGKMHIDIAEVINPYNDYTSLREWSYRMGDTDEIGESGADCLKMFEAGEYDNIKLKCTRDLLQTFLVYKRIKGWI